MNTLRSKDRGYANIGWLKSRYTFSFGSYYHSKYQNCESIRVINEDHVKEGESFPLHPHANYEIFSYIVSGTIVYKDSKNTEECSRGDVQFTSAGSGIPHNEFAKNGAGDLHLIQVWVKPSSRNLTPSYLTLHFSEEQKTNKFCAILLPLNQKEKDEMNDVIRINQDIKVFATILEKNNKIEYVIGVNRKGLVHVIEKEDVKLNVINNQGESVELYSGDCLFLNANQSLTFDQRSEIPVEFLLFDLAIL